jgi:Na+/H+ antiporter NhaD/arsenite permease-like protein
LPSERRHAVHTVIFFIFLVSNIGGSLTPLGDPPLFLGYLRGVPFWWTLKLFYPWICTVCLLLSIYYLLDSLAYRRETQRDLARDEREVTPLGLDGKINFLWLSGVVAAVALVDPSRPLPGTDWKPFPYLREGLLLALTASSWFFTPRNSAIRQANEFNFGAIQEVACLFLGIFVCMQTPVEFLQARGPELGLKTPIGFFWASGTLSSFLDNAPTYVVFFETAKSLAQSAGLSAAGALALPGGAIALEHLMAISLGSVFMGSMTYIGNGPNFMVKAIAESRGVKMPSFFAYMLWSIGILLPTFFALTLVFLRS